MSFKGLTNPIISIFYSAKHVTAGKEPVDRFYKNKHCNGQYGAPCMWDSHIGYSKLDVENFDRLTDRQIKVKKF